MTDTGMVEQWILKEKKAMQAEIDRQRKYASGNEKVDLKQQERLNLIKSQYSISDIPRIHIISDSVFIRNERFTINFTARLQSLMLRTLNLDPNSLRGLKMMKAMKEVSILMVTNKKWGSVTTPNDKPSSIKVVSEPLEVMEDNPENSKVIEPPEIQKPKRLG